MQRGIAAKKISDKLRSRQLPFSSPKSTHCSRLTRKKRMDLLQLIVIVYTTTCINQSWSLRENSDANVADQVGQSRDQKQNEGSFQEDISSKYFNIEKTTHHLSEQNRNDASSSPVGISKEGKVKIALRRHRHKIRHGSQKKMRANLLIYYLKSDPISPLTRFVLPALLRQMPKSKLKKKVQYMKTIRLQ